MHYYKRNLGDYAKKAGRLSILQHGVYNLLIDACYDREMFPTRDEALDWVWASTPEEEQAVDFVLRKFFSLENGVYVQNRIAEEIAEYHEFCRIQEEKGKKGGRPKKKPDGKDNKPAGFSEEPGGKPAESQRGPKKTLTTNHYPLSTNHKPGESDADAPPPPDENPAPKRKRATRIPDDWVLTDDHWNECQRLRPDLINHIETVGAKFVDHWRGKPGRDGTKADWMATWRNWLRNEKAPRAPPQNARSTTLHEDLTDKSWAN